MPDVGRKGSQVEMSDISQHSTSRMVNWLIVDEGDDLRRRTLVKPALGFLFLTVLKTGSISQSDEKNKAALLAKGQQNFHLPQDSQRNTVHMNISD